MKNNQYVQQVQYKKGFANIALIGVVIIFGIVLYLILNQQINVVKSDATHKISPTELIQTQKLFEKNKLDIDNLQFVGFQADNENRLQTTYQIHVAANQIYKGLPIFGAIIYHFNKSTGILDSISGKRITNLGISIIPRVTVDEAVKKSGVKSRFLNGELIIYSIDKTSSDLNSEFEYILAWKINPRESEYPVAFVDATNGNVLYYFNGIYY